MRINIVLAILLTCFLSNQLFAQHFEPGSPKVEYDNIHVEKLASDSLNSTFAIWIKKSVPEHYHAEHTETVVVLQGEGMMTLGSESFLIREGSTVYIPKGTPHSVKVSSKVPLKVISVQSPMFSGKDRIFTNQPSSK